MDPVAHTWTPLSNDVSLLPVLRALTECYTDMAKLSSRHIESLGLTPARFDVLSALGDTPGMTVKELCEIALITKGTLLPVIASMEERGLVTRAKGMPDSRQTLVTLTPEGQALYEATFLVHVSYMRACFDSLSTAEEEQLIALLGKVRAACAAIPPSSQTPHP